MTTDAEWVDAGEITIEDEIEPLTVEQIAKIRDDFHWQLINGNDFGVKLSVGEFGAEDMIVIGEILAIRTCLDNILKNPDLIDRNDALDPLGNLIKQYLLQEKKKALKRAAKLHDRITKFLTENHTQLRKIGLSKEIPLLRELPAPSR